MAKTRSPGPTVSLTIVVDEWYETTVELVSTGANHQSSVTELDRAFLLAFRQAEHSLALIVPKNRSGVLSGYVQRLLFQVPRLTSRLRLRHLRMKRFSNRRQAIIQFSWYASQHPFKQ